MRLKPCPDCGCYSHCMPNCPGDTYQPEQEIVVETYEGPTVNAILWISGRTCRIIIKDQEGNVIDLCDDWNNIASAQSWVYDTYSEAEVKTIRDPARIKELDEEWNRCKFGSG